MQKKRGDDRNRLVTFERTFFAARSTIPAYKARLTLRNLLVQDQTALCERTSRLNVPLRPRGPKTCFELGRTMVAHEGQISSDSTVNGLDLCSVCELAQAKRQRVAQGVYRQIGGCATGCVRKLIARELVLSPRRREQLLSGRRSRPVRRVIHRAAPR